MISICTLLIRINLGISHHCNAKLQRLAYKISEEIEE